ncbi:MAG: hypothetical protein IKE41_05020 [Clostridia bacterium]|nr:hypothetical protein [Clostridia bacterium]MBR2735309.1 hypothetical protein [Clostridia bacterium]
MKVDAKTLIRKYGQPITITVNSVKSASFAFIQPLRMDEQSSLYGDYNPSDVEQYLYIGLPDFTFDDPENTIITFNGETYSVVKSESVWLSGVIIYERAVLEKTGN